jgi:hypothetical protein
MPYSPLPMSCYKNNPWRKSVSYTIRLDALPAGGRAESEIQNPQPQTGNP